MLLALRRTRDALGLTEHAPLGLDQANVVLKHLLLQGLGPNESRYWRAKCKQDSCAPLRECLRGKLLEIWTFLAEGVDFAAGFDDEWRKLEQVLDADDLYRNRVIDLTVEAVLSEAMTPELCIELSAANPYAMYNALHGGWQHVVIFASRYFFCHDFYPLAVDAYANGVEKHGEPRINVLGTHADWLTDDGRLNRVIYLDAASNRLIETGLEIPVRPDRVQFLCLGKQEQELHEVLSKRFDCIQVNPAPVSALADDKAATLAGWAALGVRTPPSREILPGNAKAAFDFFEQFAECVVKPNQATEGENVAYFQRDLAHTPALFQSHLEHCWKRGPALVQKRCDQVFYRDPATGLPHSLALRLNLCGGAGKLSLQSGYAQLGLDIRYPASVGRGGHIRAIHEILPHLHVFGVIGRRPVHLDAGHWRRIRDQAELAAGLFEGLLLVGLDLVLDIDDAGEIVPVFLEANPRPAGLSHSRLLGENPYEFGEIGVGLGLWSSLDKIAQIGFRDNADG